MTTWDAGMSVTADRLNDVPGYVAEDFRATSSASFTTTETVLQDVTFTAVAGAKYKATVVQSIQANASGGSAQCRIRVATGATVGSADLQVSTCVVPFYGVSMGYVFTLVGTFDASADGDMTVGVTAVRNTGTATLTSFGNVGQVNTILIERVG